MNIKTSDQIEYRKLSPELIDKIAYFVAQGNYYSTSCHACGVGETIFYEWLKQADLDEQAGLDETVSLPMKLVKAIKNAEAEAEAERVARIRKAGEKGNWLADMTHLERRHPNRWGRKDRTAVTIDEHKQVTITHVEVRLPPGVPSDNQVIEGESRVVGELVEAQEEDENSENT